MAAGLNVSVSIGAKVAGSVNASASAVENRFTRMGRRVKLAAAEMSAAMSRFNKAANGVSGLIAAGGFGFTMKAALGAGTELDHELQALRNAGRTTTEVAEAIAAANKTIRELPTSTLAGNLALINETTSAFGDYHHAIANVGRNQKLAFMLSNSASHLGGGEGMDTTRQLGDLIRMLEMRGAANDEKRYGVESELAYKAMMFTRGRVGGSEFRAFASTGNPIVKTLSNDYLYKVLPALMQEYGADTTGTMHQSLANTILGKVGMGGATYAKEWMRLGLLDKSQAKYANNGSVKGWNAGAITGTNEFLQNPLAWAEKYLLPALQKAGVNTEDNVAVQIELSKLIGKNTASRLLGSLVNTNDRKRLHKDAAFTEQVPGVDKSYMNTLLNDPKAGVAALKAASTNLMASMSAPIMIPIARAMVNVAEGFNSLALVIEKHPGLGKAITGIGIAIGGMVGLRLASIALRFVSASFGIFTTAARIAASAGGFALRTLLGLFVTLTPTVAGVSIELTALGAGLAAAFWPITAIVVGLGVAFAVLFAKWNGVKAFFSGIGEGFSKALSPETRAAMSAFGDAVGGLFRDLFGWMAPVVGAVKDTFEWISKLFAPANVPAWQKAGEGFGGVLAGMVNSLVGFITKIAEAIQRVREFFGAASNGGAASIGLSPAPRGEPGSMGAAAGFSAVPGRQSGGWGMRGSWYRVNERGQEFFAPGASGTFLNSRASASLLSANSNSPSGGGDNSVSIGELHIHGANDPQSTRRIVREELQRIASGQRGGLHD